jgi:hypothetical protein
VERLRVPVARERHDLRLRDLPFRGGEPVARAEVLEEHGAMLSRIGSPSRHLSRRMLGEETP